MTTYNGKHEDLQFRCKSCNYDDIIIVDPYSKEDMQKLGNWLTIHSEAGGDYINVPSKKLNEIQDLKERLIKLEKELKQ